MWLIIPCKLRSLPLLSFVVFIFLLVLFRNQAPPKNRIRTSRIGVSEWPSLPVENEFILSNSELCSGNESISVIILITSHPSNTQIRQKLRDTLPSKTLRKLGMRRLFLLGKAGEEKKHSKYHVLPFNAIRDESEKYGDILVGNFEESYKNLTLKHLMGLRWVVNNCSHASLILKQDDDIIVDFLQLHYLLSQGIMPFSSPKSRRVIVGKVLAGQKVERDPKSKWFVSKSEYSSEFFPSFVSGWAYITSPAVAEDLVRISETTPNFWIDDAHITGTLREKVGVTLIDFSQYFTVFKGHIQCCIATSLGVLKPEEKGPFWCDFLVGPSMDDFVIIEHFLVHATFCHTTKLCKRRTGRKRLEKTCVITNNMIVDDFRNKSKALVNANILGSWKPMPL